jgi:hypothetical protein
MTPYDRFCLPPQPSEDEDTCCGLQPRELIARPQNKKKYGTDNHAPLSRFHRARQSKNPQTAKGPDIYDRQELL